MATERIDIVVSENGSRTVKRNLEGVGAAGAQAAQGVNLLKAAMASIGIGLGVAQVIRMADGYTALENRLKLVTSGSRDLAYVNEQLFQSANRTYASYEATADLYGKVARSAGELGLSQRDLLTLTETVNKAVVVSGTASSEAAGGIRQLAQAIGSGVLRGDELNSLMENMPRLAMAIADGMGVGIGQLRKLGEEGALTSRKVTDALLSQARIIDAEFEKMTPTIGNSFQILTNSLTKFVGEMNKASGISLVLGSAMRLLANNLDSIATAAAVAATAFLLWKAALAVGALVAYAQGLMAIQVALGATATQAFVTGVAVRGLNAILAASPFVLAALGATAAAGALVYLGSQAIKASAILDGLESSGKEAGLELLEMEAKARGAGMSVDSLTDASALSNPILAALAGKYGEAADQAKRLAINAREAAIAQAQVKITTLEADRDALGTGGAGPFGNRFKQAAALLGEIGIGPSLKERAEGIKAINAQIGIYQRQVSLLKDVPDSFFDPAAGPAAESKKDKGKKGGGGGGFDRAAFLEDVAIGTSNAIKLTSILDEEWRAVQSQVMGVNEQLRQSGAAQLTEAETLALQDKFVALERAAALEATRDSIAQRALGPKLEQLRVEAAGQQLLEASIITTRQYAQAVDEASLAVLRASGEYEDGLEAGILMVKMQTESSENAARAVVEQYNSIAGPQQRYSDGLQAIDKLLQRNRISADEAAQATRRLRIEYLQTQTDMQSGMELGKLNVEEDNANVGARVARAYQDEWNRANGAMRELQDRAAVLKQLMEDDPINSGRYAQALREVGIEALIVKGNMPDASMFDVMRGGLARFVADFKGMMPGLAQAWGDWVQKIGDGFADAVGRAIVYGEDLGEALSNVARQAMAELISSLVKLGIQWLIMQVIGNSAQKAMASTAAAAGGAVAMAWAPAAAAVSLATFGANGVPAGIAIAAVNALSLGFAAAGQAGGAGFKDGGWTGSGGRSAVAGVVHGQEYVFDADATKRLGVPFLEALRQGRHPGYMTGGYVGKRQASSAMAMGAAGQVDGAGANGGGDSISISIDARGAEAGVEQKIHQALDEALPVFLAKARKQEAKVDEARGRRKIGGR